MPNPLCALIASVAASLIFAVPAGAQEASTIKEVIGADLISLIVGKNVRLGHGQDDPLFSYEAFGLDGSYVRYMHKIKPTGRYFIDPQRVCIQSSMTGGKFSCRQFLVDQAGRYYMTHFTEGHLPLAVTITVSTVWDE